MTNRNKLTAKVVEKFDEYYKKFLETNDLSQVVDKYNSMLISMDSEVKVLYGMAGDKQILRKKKQVSQ